ncbi:hypothetical protein [Brevundimonas nasdae]|uniref:Uncharacterized protein n=1 Tax=Brevundimonas nasdae TaxID=172043 RepID=A0ABX8TJX0_9CAUL|nr:hypothetical protein [Brevundimonas nasdae]QYC10690.1 hypothetical protein KWG56_01330 [Brevundimonas nasdae]QYC13477.1 hypothetical protein KWG63_14885 [Brevundimonas nasdae]
MGWKAGPRPFDNHIGPRSAAVGLIDLLVSERFDAKSVSEWRLWSDLVGTSTTKVPQVSDWTHGTAALAGVFLFSSRKENT